MAKYKSIVPGEIPVPELHQHLLGSINPRPIAFVASLDKDGNKNLAPFSFFNVFGANPPIVVFSPARRGRDNTTKDTYENIKDSGECTVNIVSFPMTHQMVLSSSEYPSDFDEFEKSGLTAIPSDMVKTPRVAESPSQMECKVRDIVNYGEVAGGGNLIIAEVVKMHIKEEVFGDDGKIDPFKIDTVGRCGKAYYVRSNAGLFKIANPKGKDNVGFDKMPERIRNSSVLSGNDLGQLGKHPTLPTKDEVMAFLTENEEIRKLLNEGDIELTLHQRAKAFIEDGNIENAWCTLMSNKV